MVDVIVIGGGHAGVEAALACARLKKTTILYSMHIDMIASMPCNPSVGGPAKGIVVREIDALGGEMGKAADATALQFKMLNTTKGPDLFMRGRRVFDEVAKRESIRLCQAAKELHIPLEYNLAGAAYNDIMHTMQYPHIDFWKTAAEVGNTAIIGVDAHEPAALETDSYREEGIALLSGLGMKITDTLPLKDFTSYE